MKKKLTKKAVDALRFSETTLVFDSELAGFGIRVTPNKKTFFVQYRVGSGRKAPKPRMSIGEYGILTVEEARTRAREILADVTRGGDPAQARRHRKAAPTLGEFGEEYLADAEARLKPKSGKGSTSHRAKELPGGWAPSVVLRTRTRLVPR